ncbi:MAG: erythromycin esterase family protein [Pseudomonadota bacterium]
MSLLLLSCAQAVDASGPARPAVSLSLQDLTPSGEPFGWYVQGDAATLEQYVQTDPASGLPRWVLRNRGTSPALIYTRSETGGACHRRLRIAAEARTEDSGQVGGVISVAGEADAGAPTTLTRRWVEVRHELDGIPCLAPEALVGFSVRGHAELRRLHILLDGRPEVVPTLAPVRWADLAALRRVAASPGEPQRTPNLTDVLGRRVVALGDNGPGASSAFASKFALVRHLASTGRLQTISLEVPAVAAEHVDRYTRGVDDDRSSMMDALASTPWRFAHRLALIDWLRATNGERAQPIRLVGFDVQQPRWALRALERAGIRIDEVLAPWQRGEAARALTALEALAPRAAADPELARYLRLARRGLQMERPDLSGESRGFYMADEVLRLARGQSGQLLLWADNTQVSRQAGQIGGALAEALGADYAAIAWTFAEGTYAAAGTATPLAAQAPYPGTHEHLLANTGLERFVLALADVSEEHPLRERRGLRVLGAAGQSFDQFLPLALAAHFDAIGFDRRTTPAHREE